MKKKLSILLVITMLLALCVGCSKTEENNALVVEDGMIKYSNNGKMEDVISLEDLLTGKNNTSSIEAKEIELFVEDGYIVWNYIGETSVHKLISLSELAGSKGLTGAKGEKGDTGATGAKGAKGEDGENSYLHVKYLNVDPANATSSDLLDDPADYLGVCADANETAPTEVDAYNWYLIKGETGEKGETGATGAKGEKGDKGDIGATGPAGADGINGQDGANAYVHIKYLSKDPATASSSDLLDNPADYMGIVSNNSETAPADINAYKWYKIKGETGEKGETGATGAKGDKGDTGATGPAGADGGSNYDNVAIYSCSVEMTSDNSTSTSCLLEYQGSNISTTLNNNSTVTNYIILNDAGRYLVQIQGGTYFKSVTGASIAMSVSSSDTSYASVSSRKYLRNGTTELFFNYNDTFTCEFSDSDIKFISSASGNIGVPSGTSLGSSSYLCDYSMTITKLD